MPETSVPTPPGFDALSKAEQVRYLQALWDQISQEPGALPVPETHMRLAEARLKRHQEDPSRSHSAFEVLDRLADTSSTDSKSK
jgi:putative addiction module component (TIGR02574 family)